jgi:tetratricopeptide (TPR) repeat protein
MPGRTFPRDGHGCGRCGRKPMRRPQHGDTRRRGATFHQLCAASTVIASRPDTTADMGLSQRRAPAAIHRLAERLAVSDERGLLAELRRHWRPSDLAALLDSDNLDTVKTAAICLGLVGTFAEVPTLSRTLHHDDYFVVNITERTLWNIWFRASTDECNTWLQEAIAAMQAGAYDDCEALLDRILLADPDFAEACNQRAIVHYLTGRFASSLMACRRTLALNPYHFGAAAGSGHNHLQLGNFADAKTAYQHALKLHPRMEGVRQQLRRAKENLPTQVNAANWRQPS